jgi:multidrug transporter EmrE-like cation transporter
VTALGAFLLWGEGLRRLQLVGVGVVLVGVALLAVIQS